MRDQLAGKDLSQVQRIYVIRPRSSDTFAPLREDEFGVPSASHEWNIPAMVSLLGREMGLKHSLPQISSLHPTDDAFVPGPLSHLIIDMRINH